MKNIVINYTETADNMFKIVSINNLLNIHEADIDKEVKRLYYNTECEHIFINSYNSISLRNRLSKGSYQESSFIINESIFTKEQFTDIISHFKKAGNRLSNIIKSVNNYKIKSITI